MLSLSQLLQAKGGSFSPRGGGGGGGGGGVLFQLNGCGLHMYHVNSCV